MNMSEEISYLENMVNKKKAELQEFRTFADNRKREIDYLEQIIFTLKRKDI